jgi:hypothetical protein
MTPEEIKLAVDNNLRVLAEVVLTLEPKLRVAEGLIQETIKGLSQHQSVLPPRMSLDVEISGVHYDLKVYNAGDVRLEMQGEDWTQLGPRDILLLADMLPSITAFVATETNKVDNEFPRLQKPADPQPPQDGTHQKKRRWYHCFIF